MSALSPSNTLLYVEKCTSLSTTINMRPSNKEQRFRLYRPNHQTSSKGEFIHVKERYWCGDDSNFCLIDPKRDPIYIPKIVEPNFWVLRVNSNLVLIYTCKVCKGVLTGGREHLALVLSRVPYPDETSVFITEMELLRQELKMNMLDTDRSGCPLLLDEAVNGYEHQQRRNSQTLSQREF
ncbi:uncharacterized protein LOC142342296 isoform X2 [Convolutriloba macropyga]|uniref:uncharacterized protein LOC142342296 isoform X2 n=1 Tax=Convolutriloba macropyga TaxID=536237 RepID=UPI003F51C6F0